MNRTVMSRAERLLTLLECLRRHKRPVSGSVLAEELGVSLRTIYRDIAALQGQGAAIEGESGVGYVLKPGFTLPPLMFSESEIKAIALGAQWVAERGGSNFGKSACDALAKITAVLTPELRRELSQSPLLIGPIDAIPVSDTILNTIHTALRHEWKIHLEYRDKKGALSSRTIWPIALGFFERVQILVGWCELRWEDVFH